MSRRPQHDDYRVVGSVSNTGVLTITGTSGADAITVHDLNSKVTIDGITTSYTASQVKSIVINGGGGNDKITLDNGGKAGGFGIAVTINETAGSDTLQPTTGRAVSSAARAVARSR